VYVLSVISSSTVAPRSTPIRRASLVRHRVSGGAETARPARALRAAR
jgi:hypothetical protein